VFTYPPHKLVPVPWISKLYGFSSLSSFAIVSVAVLIPRALGSKVILNVVLPLATMGVVGFLKLFGWMQMDKNAILRELKRLELQVSSLAGKMS